MRHIKNDNTSSWRRTDFVRGSDGYVTSVTYMEDAAKAWAGGPLAEAPRNAQVAGRDAAPLLNQFRALRAGDTRWTAPAVLTNAVERVVKPLADAANVTTRPGEVGAARTPLHHADVANNLQGTLPVEKPSIRAALARFGVRY